MFLLFLPISRAKKRSRFSGENEYEYYCSSIPSFAPSCVSYSRFFGCILALSCAETKKERGHYQRIPESWAVSSSSYSIRSVWYMSLSYLFVFVRCVLASSVASGGQRLEMRHYPPPPASNACLVGEKPTCSVPAFFWWEGLWSHTTAAMHDKVPPPPGRKSAQVSSRQTESAQNSHSGRM